MIRSLRNGLAVTGYLLVCSTAFATPPPPGSAFHELVTREYLFEVMRYLYRWYLDEQDVRKSIERNAFVFWYREVHPHLDPGDNSRFGEIMLPRMGVRVQIKKPDYEIPKLGIRVHSDNFKVVNVSKISEREEIEPGWRQLRVDYVEMRDYLFRTRNLLRPPAGELLARMRLAVREELAEEYEEDGSPLPEGEQVVHLASLSPVANETWVFWEAGRVLLRFSSDIDLVNPALWDQDEMHVDLYNIDEQVVVTLAEVAGSNAYLTRDQVGRALFNCIVLGERVVVKPLEESSPAGSHSGDSRP